MKSFSGKDILLFIVIGFFAFVSFFGLWLGMNTMPDGKMSNCPFMNNTDSLCSMNVMEHIRAWQSIFTAIPLKEKMSLAFSLLSVLMLFLVPKFFDQLFKYLNLFYRERYRHLQKIFIPRPLEEAFSNGILNPKIF